MAGKLGLAEYDRPLTQELLKLMYEDDADFTNTFRWDAGSCDAELDIGYSHTSYEHARVLHMAVRCPSQGMPS